MGDRRREPVRAAGDAALILELEPRIDVEVNARAVAIAAALRDACFDGVRDVVAAYRSVAVCFDPLRTDVAALKSWLSRTALKRVQPLPQRRVEVPVAYGGEFGPDLKGVAQHAGILESEVVRRHASRVYQVYMLGFVPGFPYMGVVDPMIALPRRSSPRASVPAGSVAIAGAQTGIYPTSTPGGWHVVGRTDLRLFDTERTPPALLAPGDQVTFVPVESVPAVAYPPAQVNSVSPRTVSVLRPGLLTTIQDLGRWGYQSLGVPVAGPMDVWSHRMANQLVGNAEGAATLEVTLVGPELRVEAPSVLAVTGADLGASVDGVPLSVGRTRSVSPGSILRFGERRLGARAYVAFDGGIDVPPVLGSRALHVSSRMGGGHGRPLDVGDRLGLGEAHHPAPTMNEPLARSRSALSHARLRVLAGPQLEHFDDEALDALVRAPFIVSPLSDRMGYRLVGPRKVQSIGGEMISDVVVFGGIQVPPSGDPILLMADRPTTGGYPQVATVISADLPLAGQLAPGDSVQFVLCREREAVEALIARERERGVS